MYEDVHVSPMLIGIEKEAFDDRNFIYELKLMVYVFLFILRTDMWIFEIKEEINCCISFLN